MGYTQEQQNKILRKLNAGVIGKRKDWVWDRIVIKTKYTKKELLSIAKKYNTRKQFQDNEKSAYESARNQGLLDDICSHMKNVRTSITIERVKSAAKKYKTRGQFQKSKDVGLYSWAQKNKILDEVCKHMKNPPRILTKELVTQESKKYSSKGEFSKKDSSAYTWSVRNKIINELFPYNLKTGKK